jgi:hypothetical protein
MMPTVPLDVADARLTSTMTLGGITVVDGGFLDTWAAWPQGTPANRPFYDSISLGNGPCVTGGQLSQSSSPVSFLSRAGFAIGVPFSYVLVYRSDTPKACFFEDSADVTVSQGVKLTNTTGFTGLIRATSLQGLDSGQGWSWALDNAIHYLILTCDGSTTALYVDGAQVFVAQNAGPGTAAFSVAATLMAAHAGGSPFTGALGCRYTYARVLSAAERAQVDADVRASWRITPQGRLFYQSIGVGNSIMLGAALKSTDAKVNALHSFLGVAAVQLGFRFGIPLNLGISGAMLAGILAEWISTGAPALVDGPNFACGEGGINDLGVGRTVPQMNADTQALYTRMSSDMSAKAAFGRQICAVTTLFGPSGNTPNGQLVNANTRANYLSWGAPGVTMILADFGADPLLVAANANYTQDGTHPTLPGDQRAGTILANALVAAAA